MTKGALELLKYLTPHNYTGFDDCDILIHIL